VFFDYDSTLNPGQGNAPLTESRAALLKRYLSGWREAGVDIYVLTWEGAAREKATMQRELQKLRKLQ